MSVMVADFINYKGKTVAVTGASGYIGSVLADALKNRSADVIRVSRGALLPETGMTNLQADVRDYSCWQNIISKADIIFHLAGITSLYAAAKNPVESLNSTVLPLNHLINVAQELNRVPRVVFASTATIYGITKDLPVSEARETHPITLYDLHKRFAEEQLALANSQGILQSVSLRLANVYGPSLNTSSAMDRGVLNKVSKMALRGEDLQLFGDGNYVRDYIHIDDVVNAFLCAGNLDGFAGRCFNLASGQGVTLKEAFQLVINQVAKATGQKVTLNSVPWPVGADLIEYRNFTGDISAIYDAFNWRPNVSLQAGVEQMVTIFSENDE